MIALFLVVTLLGGVGWALLAVGGVWAAGAALDLAYALAVLVSFAGFSLWRRMGGRTRLDVAYDRIRAELRRRGVEDPDGWMGLKDENGIPYL